MSPSTYLSSVSPHMHKDVTKSAVEDAITSFSCHQGSIIYSDRGEFAFALHIVSKQSPQLHVIIKSPKRPFISVVAVLGMETLTVCTPSLSSSAHVDSYPFQAGILGILILSDSAVSSVAYSANIRPGRNHMSVRTSRSTIKYLFWKLFGDYSQSGATVLA